MMIPLFNRNIGVDIDGLNERKTQRELSEIHIRVKQRNGKKCITLIEGLAKDLDLKKISKALRKTFNTSVSILKIDDDKGNDRGDDEVMYHKILQLQGDKRKEVNEFLIKYKIWEEPDPPIKVHGF